MLGKGFTLCSIYCSNQSLWKIRGITQINLDYFTTDKSNKVKISREIMLCQGYFLKNCSGDEGDPKRCWDWCMSEDDRKRIELILTDERQFKVGGIVSCKINLLKNYKLLNGAAA